MDNDLLWLYQGPNREDVTGPLSWINPFSAAVTIISGHNKHPGTVVDTRHTETVTVSMAISYTMGDDR